MVANGRRWLGGGHSNGNRWRLGILSASLATRRGDEVASHLLGPCLSWGLRYQEAASKMRCVTVTEAGAHQAARFPFEKMVSLQRPQKGTISMPSWMAVVDRQLKGIIFLEKR